MIKTFIQLELLKRLRSTSFARSLAIGIFLAFLGLLVLAYLLLMGLALNYLISEFFSPADNTVFLNSYLVFFFLFEIIYRYFIQQLPVFSLEHFLHLPVAKSGIIHYLLVSSFISPLTILPLLLFGPFAIMEIAEVYGSVSAGVWLGSVLLTSWTIHWVMLWFKQRFEDSFVVILVIFCLLLLGSGSTYLGWLDIGAFFEPIFTFALESAVPVVLLSMVMVLSYFLCFAFYRQNAYLEKLSEEDQFALNSTNFGILSKFGLAGEMASLEWKLILRHKKSRTYLTICLFFLLYGLIFYTNPMYQTVDGIANIYIFVGIFVTGIFILQYGQLFLSWNSSMFDFFIFQRKGLEALVKGKYLLFMGISLACFLLSLPYVFFGWEVLWVHLATFLFNLGITIHLVIYFALWKPKPMDLNKGAIFNYEGVGIAQFLMIIPILGIPYLIYLPISILVSDYAGLLALALLGLGGLIAFPKLSDISVKKVLRNRYEISSSFRQEL
ncbi:DUF5687 family protein [Pleomorphovibrio marinus]|uniref:DUF5687 family protein n=1 Tax=Pleomorphovibrio marinus TaxID=2164132 RepID=UPI000E09F16A|nr:DUF5687 family protein [Pleomorphovibrio marinus]